MIRVYRNIDQNIKISFECSDQTYIYRSDNESIMLVLFSILIIYYDFVIELIIHYI